MTGIDREIAPTGITIWQAEDGIHPVHIDRDQEIERQASRIESGEATPKEVADFLRRLGAEAAHNSN